LKRLTKSQALALLGTINSIKDPLFAGVCGLSRAKHFKRLSSEAKKEMKRELLLLKNLCEVFGQFTVYDQTKDGKKFEAWILSKPREKESNPRLEAYLGIALAFPTAEERKSRRQDMKFLLATTKKALAGKLASTDLNRALDLLKTIEAEVAEKLRYDEEEAERSINETFPGI
jgi:hypothetical protein